MKSNFADESAVIAIPEPEWTKTWHPTSHSRVINAVTNVLEEKGIGVKSKYYSLTKDGNKLPPAFAYAGPECIFQQLGFREVQRLAATRPLYRLEIN